MHSTQSTFAVIVSAETFELLNAAGEVVGRLAAIAASFAFVGGSGLEMLHLDATVNDSALGWTQQNPDGTGQQVTLRGPSDIGVTDPPTVLLAVNPTTSRARLRAGRKAAASATAAVDTITDTAGDAQIVLDAIAGLPTSTLCYVWALATGNAGIADLKVDGYTGAAYLNGTGTGTGDVSLRLGGLNRVRAQPGGLVELLGGGGAVIAANNGVAITPAVNQGLGLNPSGTGRIVVNNSPVFLLNGFATAVLPGSAGPGFRSVLGMNISPNVEAGDLIEFTLTVRVICIAVGGAFIGELQVFGPGGTVILPQRMIATNWPLNHDNTLTVTWLYTAALGSGAYTFAPVGGATGGAWTMVAPDTWANLKRYSQRGFQ